MIPSKVTEVYLLCGFLGSGKSTLLSRLIGHEQDRGRKIAVIMNELGEVSIDSSFIPADLPLKELVDGCICCSLQDDLSSQIEQLLEEYAPDAIYIESTGAAQPVDIIDACTDPGIAARLEVRAVITIVDAKQWDERVRLQPEVRGLLVSQMKHASIIILNKVDTLFDPDRLAAIKESMQLINTRALIVAAVRTEIDPAVLRAAQFTVSASGTHDEMHVHHHLHLRSFTYYPPRALERQAFENWLRRISGRLYRAKGYVHLKEKEGLFLFQYSYEQALFTRFLVDMPYEPVLVFIGEGLNPSRMESELSSLQ
jgi:G3E family GTPase